MEKRPRSPCAEQRNPPGKPDHEPDMQGNEERKCNRLAGNDRGADQAGPPKVKTQDLPQLASPGKHVPTTAARTLRKSRTLHPRASSDRLMAGMNVIIGTAPTSATQENVGANPQIEKARSSPIAASAIAGSTGCDSPAILLSCERLFLQRVPRTSVSTVIAPITMHIGRPSQERPSYALLVMNREFSIIGPNTKPKDHRRARNAARASSGSPMHRTSAAQTSRRDGWLQATHP